MNKVNTMNKKLIKGFRYVEILNNEKNSDGGYSE